MPRVIVETSTILKTKPLPSADLDASEKMVYNAGTDFFITEYVSAKNQHIKMKLATKLLASDGHTRLDWIYAYDPHVRIEGEEIHKLIKLDVPYFSQNDNDSRYHGAGWRQCNLTSNAMLLDFLIDGELTAKAKSNGFNEPEAYYGSKLYRYGDTTDHTAQTAALADFGIESYWSHTLSQSDVLRSLQSGIPVVAGFAYRQSGHICVIVGHDPDKREWLVHDPYGIRYGVNDYYEVGADGSYDRYSYETMNQIYWDMGGEAGWGRICVAVRGRKTGLPHGL